MGILGHIALGNVFLLENGFVRLNLHGSYFKPILLVSKDCGHTKWIRSVKIEHELYTLFHILFVRLLAWIFKIKCIIVDC